ncbi:3-phenylpropionate/trans-cinnamate dioxygenase ferredoxin subunit [Arthrobacter silviterrae]|uniref:Non-heme iron oxygenase ferredoxin subunit n=1 Tax=Arthrobacter silviterrae TaxID=2026658 RepID=A0ABX0D6V5_9MICC|nr:MULTISPECIES: non-heme iron oxygenase ferredoxin subunit [Arthrobacter]MCU6481767.1 non-heme iron oxygenase ferredoxin subunit [Arthrobacter sp. A2-55]MDQ0276144.1 3-phenylpropionate/trans-cinnamate dioxygenase ferredoxin subunit [Arthrobacter silviterrae]NGN82609.1 non-heme iron oxygenase ferredoxin subunit [Arthrobacter silviterrae]
MSDSSTPAGVVVCQDSDVEVKSSLLVEVDDFPIAIVRDSYGVLHAIGDTCSHAEISLSEGDVEDGTIECWAHGSSFDLKTGEPLTLPAFEPVPVFNLEVHDGDVYVDVTNILNGVSIDN